jgi:hypothetical protein
MARVSLQDLALKEEQLPTAHETLEDLPQFGGFTPPPQPGPYRFKLPANLASTIETVETKLTPPTRIAMILDRDNPLVITQAPSKDDIGQPFQTRISNVERNRGTKGETRLLSDMDYVLQAVGHKVHPKTNKQYMEAIIQYGGREFGADIGYNFTCREDKPIRADDGNGAVVEVPGQMGCGWRFYSGTGAENVSAKRGYTGRVNGQYPTEIACKCGAVLRAFANLDNIRK